MRVESIFRIHFISYLCTVVVTHPSHAFVHSSRFVWYWFGVCACVYFFFFFIILSFQTTFSLVSGCICRSLLQCVGYNFTTVSLRCNPFRFWPHIFNKRYFNTFSHLKGEYERYERMTNASMNDDDGGGGKGSDSAHRLSRVVDIALFTNDQI